MAVAIKLFNLFSRELLVGGTLGLLWGVALVAIYQLNRKRKAERGQLVGSWRHLRRAALSVL
jgi:Mg/Co/Ni transporter MgtE